MRFDELEVKEQFGHVPIYRYYESFNLRVFYARKRIRSELGLNPEDIGKDTPKGQSEDNNNN